jgi:hypothetical protein
LGWIKTGESNELLIDWEIVVPLWNNIMRWGRVPSGASPRQIKNLTNTRNLYIIVL